MSISVTNSKLPANRLLLGAVIAASATVLANILWALASGGTRDALTIIGVLAFATASGLHAYAAYGRKFLVQFASVALIATFVIEVLGVATSFPFGTYEYDAQRLGLSVAGVPLLIPFAWFMMLYPSWLISRDLFKSKYLAIPTGALLMSTWDLYLDPQMVNEGYWVWFIDGTATKVIPLTNFFGWFLSTAVIFALLSFVLKPNRSEVSNATPYALVLWVWLGSFLVNIVPVSPFFNQPAVAVSGVIGMGIVLIPWSWTLWQRR
ncbi:MAG: carotenoid biosynthesis protein [Candidatus Nanopelagicales bacterium]